MKGAREELRHAMAAIALCAALALIGGCGEESRTPARAASAHLADALALQADGDVRGAVEALGAALTLDPGLAEARLVLGRIHLEAGRGAAAEKELGLAFEAGVEDEALPADIVRAQMLQRKYDLVDAATSEATTAEMLILRGQAKTALRQPEAAVSSFNAALAADPAAFEAEIGLARVAVEMRDGWLARFHADRALALAGADPRALRLDADLTLANMDFEAAYKAFAAAHEADPGDILAPAGLARAALMLERFEEAAEALNKLYALAPNSNEAAFLRAYLEYRQGQDASAQTRLRAIVSRVPDHGQALYLLAVILNETGNSFQAEDLLTDFERENPGYAPAGRLLAAIVRARTADAGGAGTLADPPALDERNELALLGVAPFPVREAEDNRAALRRARQYAESGYLPAAAKLLEQTLAADPDNVELLDLLARVYQSESDPRALEVAGRGHELAPEHPGLLHVYGWLLVRDRQVERGAKLLELAHAKGLDSAYLHFHRGVALARLNDPAAAVAALQRALAVDPAFGHSAEARRLLQRGVRYYWGEGEFGKSAEILENLVALYPQDATVLNMVARGYFVVGDPRALETARRAHELAPGSGPVLHTYGWLLYVNGEAKQASEVLERASEAGPDSDSLAYHRAAALARLGNSAQARALVESALSDDQPFRERADAERLLAELRGPSGAGR